MSHALITSLAVSRLSGNRYVIIEAFDTAVGWYKKYGFQEIVGSEEQNRRKMFLDLIVAKRAEAIGMETLFSEATSPR
jgi:hypothetical protein